MHPLGVTSTYAHQQQADQQGGMVVCGNDGLAAELRDVYREHATLVVPATGEAASGSAAGSPERRP